MIVSALSNRAMSSYSLSIGTALALESIAVGPKPVYDPDRIIPGGIDLKNYDEVWINVLTLFRNLYGSVERNTLDQIKVEEWASVLEEEVDILRDVFRVWDAGLKIVFYTSVYDIKHKYKHARFRTDNTELQMRTTKLIGKVLTKFYEGRPVTETMKHFSGLIHPDKRIRGLILTHYAYDLLSSKDFKSLDLLESHTGVLKSKALWYTKFSDHKESMRIPFNELFLQVFGDSTIFHPHDKKLRQEILGIAEKYNWSFATTKDRIHLGLSMISNPFYRAVLNEMT